MSQKKHTPEQIISKLPFGFAQGGEPAEPREAEVELARGATVAQACKKIGVSDHTYYRWRAEYGGMRVDQAKRLKELEKENVRECLAIEAARPLASEDVLDRLTQLFIQRQIAAFEDTWHWDMSTEAVFREVVTGGGRDGALLDAFRQFLGSNDMMVYLMMTAIRLIELHRVLKPTGSIRLHCDPTASHYAILPPSRLVTTL